MRSPVVVLRADEHQTGWCRVRAELRQETELFQKVGGPEGEGPRVRDVRPGGHRLGLGPKISPADVHLFLQSHGVRELHGLLSGQFDQTIK